MKRIKKVGVAVLGFGLAIGALSVNIRAVNAEGLDPIMSLAGSLSGTRGGAGMPELDPSQYTETKGKLYKDEFDMEDDEEDRLDMVASDFMDQKMVYQYFKDKDVTVYRIMFKAFNSYISGSSTPTKIESADKVWTRVEGNEVEAVKEAAAPGDNTSSYFRFALQGKPRKQIPLKLHWNPIKNDPEYAYRNVNLMVTLNEAPGIELPPNAPNQPNAPLPTPIPDLIAPKVKQAMMEHTLENGQPSMANNTFSHEVKYEEKNGKTVYEIHFLEFSSPTFKNGVPMVSVARLWYNDEGTVKEAYLAKAEGNSRTYRFEIAGRPKTKIETTLYVMPMKEALGDGAAIQKANLLISDEDMDGIVTAEVYVKVPYGISIVEDKDLKPGDVYVQQEGKYGTEKIAFKYKAINGVNTGMLMGKEVLDRKEPVEKIIRVNDRKAYEDANRQFEKDNAKTPEDGSKNYPLRLADAKLKEIDSNMDNFLMRTGVNVKENAGKRKYTLSFMSYNGFAPSVRRMKAYLNGIEVPVEALGSKEVTKHSETYRENEDHSTVFSFELPVNADLDKLVLNMEYLDNLKFNAKMDIDFSRQVVQGREPRTTGTEEIDFATERVEDTTLEEGKEKLVQEGEKGLKAITEYDKTVDGQMFTTKMNGGQQGYHMIGSPMEVVLKQPKNKIIHVGAKKAEKAEKPEDKQDKNKPGNNSGSNDKVGKIADGKKIPETGDTSRIGLYVVSAVSSAAAGIAAVFIRKRIRK